MGETKLWMWGSQIALIGCFLLVGGSFITFYYPNGTINALYGLSVGLILMPFMWPVKYLGPALGLFHSQFFITAIILVGLSIFALFKPPTALGGMSLIMAGIVYAIAGIRGEQGLPCGEDDKKEGAPRRT